MHFGERLQFLRSDQDLTQQELADKLNMSVGMISSYEREVAFPTIRGLDTICRYFNVDPNYLLCYSRSPSPLQINNNNFYVVKLPNSIVINSDLEKKLDHYAKFICYEHQLNEHNEEK